MGWMDYVTWPPHPAVFLNSTSTSAKVFADQLQGTVNDVRGDKITARPKVLEDLPAWPSVLQKFEGKAIGFDLSASRGTAWGAYQAVTEYLSHEAGRSKDPELAARQRLAA
jgi:hypothetical protein